VGRSAYPALRPSAPLSITESKGMKYREKTYTFLGSIYQHSALHLDSGFSWQIEKPDTP
jgi:hypothetical protein